MPLRCAPARRGGVAEGACAVIRRAASQAASAARPAGRPRIESARSSAGGRRRQHCPPTYRRRGGGHRGEGRAGGVQHQQRTPARSAASAMARRIGAVEHGVRGAAAARECRGAACHQRQEPGRAQAARRARGGEQQHPAAAPPPPAPRRRPPRHDHDRGRRACRAGSPCLRACASTVDPPGAAAKARVAGVAVSRARHDLVGAA